MAGLLAWAADVVGGGGASNGEGDRDSIPLIFTPEQQSYIGELHQKATSLSRSIQDLRLRLPPPDISERLPHLHAHSLASNAALALQLNSHSSTKEEAQLREETLRKENAEYEKAISSCKSKILEKSQEADLLRKKLEDMDLAEKNLITELENAQAALGASQSGKHGDLLIESEIEVEAREAAKSALLKKIENKKKELGSMEEHVQELEKNWAQVQDNALKQPSPVQREKILDKQLHSLMEQLATKQAQAEGLISEIHQKEMELERLNGLWRRLENSNLELSNARNRLGRSSSEKGSFSSDYIVDPHEKPFQHMGGRKDHLQRLMLLRSAFVLYILALHILVFIKISF